jgi:hypothetical protein
VSGAIETHRQKKKNSIASIATSSINIARQNYQRHTFEAFSSVVELCVFVGKHQHTKKKSLMFSIG